MNYTDYGCAKCHPSLLLTGDERGIGDCKLPNEIKECKWALTRPDWMDNEPVCVECNEGFMLKNDSFTCLPVPQRNIIKNCNNYYINNTEVYCNVCQEGFTLSESRKNCESGCRLTGCENCQILNGRFYCFNCKPGFIGLFEKETMLYRKCLSCDEYQYNLERSNSTYRPT
jgi:hypothetical protein